jgi:redox-sensitive bicupin YhaK (pirin superfamily)
LLFTNATCNRYDAAKLAGENSIRVIAGDASAFGVAGAASVHTPVELLDIRMATPGVSFDIPIPDGHNTVVFVRRGGITVVGGCTAVESS